MAERVCIREISNKEGNQLLRIIPGGSGSVVRWCRAQIVLWSAQGMDVPQIAKIAFISEEPQIGVLALESDADQALSHSYPLDVLGAQTQDMIGCWLVRALQNALPDRPFVALACQTLVDADDPACTRPSKFVGQIYSKTHPKQFASDRGWTVQQDGSSWRRVLSSPKAQGIIKLSVTQERVNGETTIICASGGGIPVDRDGNGQLQGTEAVTAKDRTAALLAEQLGAYGLMIPTDIASVERHRDRLRDPNRATGPTHLGNRASTTTFPR